MKDADLQAEERRRRRLLRQMKGRRLGRLVLKGDPAAAAPPTPTKKSMFRATAAPVVENGTHEHDVVYVDVLDLGLKERPEEDRSESSALHCAMCFAVAGGSYFYRGFSCPTCEKAGQRYLLCYKCAEPLFDDDEELEAVEYNPRDRFDFEAYNSYLGDSDSNSVLPYRSVEVVFNNANIWMNRQDSDPRYIFWDLQNKDYWHPFVSKVSGLRPCFSSCRFPMAGRDEGWCLRQRRELLQELRKVIQMHRAHKNLGTRWVTSPQLLRFLEAGLKIRSQLDMEGHILEEEESPREEMGHKNELLEQLDEWEKTLNAKTPREYKLSSMPMHFNYLDADEIAEKVMELCPFLMTRDKSAQFAVACHLVPLPGEAAVLGRVASSQAGAMMGGMGGPMGKGMPMGGGMPMEQMYMGGGMGMSGGMGMGGGMGGMGMGTGKGMGKGPMGKGPMGKGMMGKGDMMGGNWGGMGDWSGKGWGGDKGKAKGKGKMSISARIAAGEPYFVGQLRKYDQDRSAGSIACKEVYQMCGQEVYAHKSVLEDRSMGVGDSIVFLIHWNSRGQPQCSLESLRLHNKAPGSFALKGTVKITDAEKGYVFVECPEVYEFFGRDVYVPKDKAPGLAVGQMVAFNVKLNKQMHPNVEDLQPCDDSLQLVAGDLSQSFEDPTIQPPWNVSYHNKRPTLSSTGEIHNATIKNFNTENGWGFVTSEQLLAKYGCDVFVHKSALDCVPSRDAGTPITFELGMTEQGKPQVMHAVPLGQDISMAVEAAAKRQRTMENPQQGMLGRMMSRINTKSYSIIESHRPVRAPRFIGHVDRVVSIYLYCCELHALSQLQLREEKERQQAPKDDRGLTVAQLVRNFGKGFQKEEAATAPGQSLATMIIEAAKKAKNLDAAVVEAVDPPKVKKNAPPAGEARGDSGAGRAKMAESMTGFEANYHSRFVRIEKEALEASYVATKEEDDYALHGGLLGNGPLPAVAAGKYFELEVLRTREGHPDGLCVGVTQTRPQDLTTPPDTMDAIPQTWIAGYDGLFWDPTEADMFPAPWNPSTLQNGDQVGVLIRPDGAFVVLVNGEVVLEREHAQVPYGPAIACFLPAKASDLFAVVDLLGSCDAVKLRLDARPSLAEPMNAAENVPQEEKEVKMSGFCLKKKGHYVRLSEDALSATYTGQTGHEMHGGLIGNEPLARNATSGVYFSVELTKTRSEMMDGLTLGVTTNGPKDLDEMTDTIDGVQACWTVGYDGQMYNGKDDRWVDLSWNGRDLHVGDVVTLQVTEAGQMKIFVNHRFVADGHSRIPCAKPLYALVDLIGTADGVRLLLDAPPPPACSVPSSAAQTATAPETATEEVDLKPFMEGWCRMRHGRLVEVSEDGLTGRYLTG
ncbi:unnamed protein product, partial [Durusdinium trenchii]